MAWLGILMAVFALGITPLGMRLDIAAGAHVSGAAVLTIWGLRIQVNVGLIRNEEGKLQLSLQRQGSPRQHSNGVSDIWHAIKRLIHFLKASEKTRAFWGKTITLQFLKLWVRIGFADASHTALSTGAVAAALSSVKKKANAKGIPFAYSAWPDFSGKPCAVQLSCILFMRLGNLFVGCAMAAISAMVARFKMKKQQREEEKSWNTPSET